MHQSLLRLPWFLAVVSLIVAGCGESRARAPIVESRKQASMNELWVEPIGMFHLTPNEVRNLDAFRVASSSVLVFTWEEQPEGKGWSPFFAISLNGRQSSTVRETSGALLLRYATFDPLATAAAGLNAGPEPLTEVRIVQFKTQVLADYRAQLQSAGARIYRYLANNALIVRAPAHAVNEIARQPQVRWIGPYRLEYKFDPPLRAKLSNAPSGVTARYRIEVFERGLYQQSIVGERIGEVGGRLVLTVPEGFVLDAMLSPEQVLQVAALDEVAHLDEWSPPEADDDQVREIGGADFLEKLTGFTGQGVRAEVLDVGVRTTHSEFQNSLLSHGNQTIGSHGTSTTGINFAKGINPLLRGLVPDAQGIVSSIPVNNRYQHTRELVQDPYFAVYQSNSWGGGLTTQYTTETQEMDDIIFHLDFLIVQSQSNAGSQLSRPQAWAKNIVSVGGLVHSRNLDMDTHCWRCGHASIGPAADGRIKPDLAHFYDDVYAPTLGTGRSPTSSDQSFISSFGGTSAATPIVAGYFGLFFQMWHNGLFGNPTGESVFDSRPHASTARAFVINTARQWNFDGETHDRTRTHQGWGLPSVQNLYEMSGQIFSVNETDVLLPLQTSTYQLEVVAGTPALKATMVYKDPMGTTSSTLHRINDLDLKVSSPGGEIYRGNNGLAVGLWSSPGGSADTKNTVENVFVENPAPGFWTVEVIATEINQDGHLQTEEIDADYALVVSGVSVPTARGPIKSFGE